MLQVKMRSFNKAHICCMRQSLKRVATIMRKRARVLMSFVSIALVALVLTLLVQTTAFNNLPQRFYCCSSISFSHRQKLIWSTMCKITHLLKKCIVNAMEYLLIPNLTPYPQRKRQQPSSQSYVPSLLIIHPFGLASPPSLA